MDHVKPRPRFCIVHGVPLKHPGTEVRAGHGLTESDGNRAAAIRLVERRSPVGCRTGGDPGSDRGNHRSRVRCNGSTLSSR
jgi:hypothetical protein